MKFGIHLIKASFLCFYKINSWFKLVQMVPTCEINYKFSELSSNGRISKKTYTRLYN